jgi:hypothetical protein
MDAEYRAAFNRIIGCFYRRVQKYSPIFAGNLPPVREVATPFAAGQYEIYPPEVDLSAVGGFIDNA